MLLGKDNTGNSIPEENTGATNLCAELPQQYYVDCFLSVTEEQPCGGLEGVEYADCLTKLAPDPQDPVKSKDEVRDETKPGPSNRVRCDLASHSDCLPTGSSPLPFSKSDLISDALNEIGLNMDYSSLSNRDKMQIYNEIKKQYATMFLENPEISKWPFLAAVAADAVLGSMDLATIGEALGSDDGKKAMNYLYEGGINIYTDMAWQYDAYLKGGINYLTSLYHAGELYCTFATFLGAD